MIPVDRTCTDEKPRRGQGVSSAKCKVSKNCPPVAPSSHGAAERTVGSEKALLGQPRLLLLSAPGLRASWLCISRAYKT
jgi:hypothetical protein